MKNKIRKIPKSNPVRFGEVDHVVVEVPENVDGNFRDFKAQRLYVAMVADTLKESGNFDAYQQLTKLGAYLDHIADCVAYEYATDDVYIQD